MSTTTTDRRSTVLYLGLALTVLATVVPLADLATLDTLTQHVRAAYPDWDAATVSLDRNAILGYLSVIGVLGAAGWLWSIRGVRKDAGWTRAVATTLFALGASVACYNLTMTGGAYANTIPHTYAILGLLPVLAGLAAVVMIWRSPRRP